MSNYRQANTQYGFIWGPAHVQRLCSDQKWGVMFTVQTDRESLDIRVTPSGLIRVEPIGKPANLEDPETPSVDQILVWLQNGNKAVKALEEINYLISNMPVHTQVEHYDWVQKVINRAVSDMEAIP